MTTQMIDMSSRFHSRPLMIDDEIVDNLSRLGVHSMKIEDLSASTAAMWLAVQSGERKPYRMEGPIAIIPVNGTLYHKVEWASSWYTGYDWINKMVDYAEQDPAVKGVLFDFASGGGEVDGAFECADKIRKMKKPTVGIANGHAYSAAYLLISACKKVVVTATGGVGSIGVVTSHMDVSEAMSEHGYKLTFMFKGKHKVDGNSYQPLPEAVQERISVKLETPYNLFVDAVAKHRSTDAQAVRNTEAQTYVAEEAKSLGLVDSVASPDETLAAFVAELNGKSWRNTMSANANEQTTTADKGNETVVTQQALDAARTEGAKVGADQERARIMGILKLDEAKGREATAQALCDQGMSVEQAKAVLATIPAASADTSAAKPNHFKDAMNNTQNPEVTAEAGSDAGKETPAHMKAINALAKARGVTPESLLK